MFKPAAHALAAAIFALPGIALAQDDIPPDLQANAAAMQEDLLEVLNGILEQAKQWEDIPALAAFVEDDGTWSVSFDFDLNDDQDASEPSEPKATDVAGCVYRLNFPSEEPEGVRLTIQAEPHLVTTQCRGRYDDGPEDTIGASITWIDAQAYTFTFAAGISVTHPEAPLRHTVTDQLNDEMTKLSNDMITEATAFMLKADGLD